MSEAKQYKLTYFNGRGLAEIIRLVFAAAGVKYEDHRLEREQWPELKPKMPFESIPVLEVDGVQIPQSHAITRFLAKRFGLFGANDIEAAQIDAFLEAMIDLRSGIMGAFREQDPEAKAKKLQEYYVGDYVKFSTLIQKNLAKHNEGKGWLVGDKLSVADLQVFNFYSTAVAMNADALKDFPLIKGLVDRVGAIPSIAEWVKNRPQTAF